MCVCTGCGWYVVDGGRGVGCGRRSVQRVLMLLHQQELLVLLLERRSRRRRRSRSFRSSVHGRLHKQEGPVCHTHTY